jgi:TRAP-type C4-dicarboxylate transport system substrate-binding protein
MKTVRFGLFILALVSMSANATDRKFEINWVLAHEPAGVFERAAKGFAEEVQRESGGNIEINIINSAKANNGEVIGAEKAYSLVKSGKLQMTQTYSSYLGRHSEKFWLFDLPFLFRDHSHATKAFQSDIGKNILASLEPDNVRGLAFTYSGGYMILPTKNRQISKMEDFKGLRVRVNQNSPVGTALMETLGAVPVVAKSSEGYETTFVRVLDNSNSQERDKKIINDMAHSLFLTTILINKEFMDSMPPKYQDIVRRAAINAGEAERADSLRDSETAKKACEKAGYQIVNMSSKEIERMKAAVVKPVYEKFAPIVGKDSIDAVLKM